MEFVLGNSSALLPGGCGAIWNDDIDLSCDELFANGEAATETEVREYFEEPNECTYAAIESAEKGEDVYGPFDSVSAMMDSLNA